MEAVEGIQDILNLLRSAIPQPEETHTALTNVANILVEEIKGRVPVGKSSYKDAPHGDPHIGLLRDSIEIIKTSSAKTVTVGVNRRKLIAGGAPSNLDYLVEYGSKKNNVGPRSFMRTSFDTSQGQLAQELEKEFKGIIERKLG